MTGAKSKKVRIKRKRRRKIAIYSQKYSTDVIKILATRTTS